MDMTNAEKREIHGEVVSLRDYFERVIQDQEKSIALALSSSRQAVEKAEAAVDRRLDLLNEFRAQAADESRKYALRESVEQTNKNSDERFKKLERLLNMAFGGLFMVSLIGVGNIVAMFFDK
jgi:DNA anti-recombination protein RmuC